MQTGELAALREKGLGSLHVFVPSKSPKAKGERRGEKFKLSRMKINCNIQQASCQQLEDCCCLSVYLSVSHSNRRGASEEAMCVRASLAAFEASGKTSVVKYQ